MLWSAYLVLIVALTGALVGATGAAFRSLRPVTQQLVRATTLLIALLFPLAAAAYFLYLAGMEDHAFSDDPFAYLMFGFLGLGGLIYAAGTAMWGGRAAHLMRAAGWVLIVIPMMIPSTLTLALVLGGPLVVTVTRIPTAEIRESSKGSTQGPAAARA